MSPIETSELERRLGAGLDARSRQASVPSADHGRAAIADRVVRRRRRRRTVQVVGSVAVVVVVLAGALALSRRSGSGRVVTGPTNPVIHLPQLGLRSTDGGWIVTLYSPGREEVVLLAPPHEQTSSAELIIAPDAATGNVGVVPGSEQSVTVRGVTGSAFVPRMPDGSAGGWAVLRWPVAPGVQALLVPSPGSLPGTSPTSGQSSGPETAGRADPELVGRLVGLADQLVPIDDTEWLQALDSAKVGVPELSSVPVLPHVSLGAGAGRAELWQVSSGATIRQVITAPSVHDQPVELDVMGKDTEATLTQGSVEVRGHPARSSSETLSQTEGPFAPGPFRTVIWFEGGFTYRLGFGPQVAEADAVALADHLAVVDATAWHDLMYPETLDTDLLPMPTDVFVVALGVDRPVPTGGLAPTSTSSTSTSSTSTTSH